jgi:hypothetical protein
MLWDTESLLNIDALTSPLVTTGIISSASKSQVTGLIGWSDSSGAVNNVKVLGGVGAAPIVSVLDIYNWTSTATTPAHLLTTSASSVLSDVDVEIPYLLGTVPILSVDVITSTASASSDGTLPNAAAFSDVEFLNLVIGGVPVPTPTVGEVHIITSGPIPVQVARVTIMPTLTSMTSATSSSADAVSLYIEILAGSLVGTEIYLAHSNVESNAFGSPTGPTAITNLSTRNLANDRAMLPAVVSLFALFSGLTGMVFYRYQIKLRD